MNGYYDINNTSYPYSGMRFGENYKVTDMRSLTPILNEPLPKEKAYKVAAWLNEQTRNGALPKTLMLSNGDAQTISEAAKKYAEKL